MHLPTIDVRDGGYYVQRARVGTRLTNFVAVPMHRRGPQGHPMYSLVQNGKSRATVEISEAAWASRAQFLVAVQGISNLAFFGKVPELKLIREFIRSKYPDEASGAQDR